MERSGIAALIALAITLGVAGWWRSTPPVPRHVILVSLDTTRADALGAYGSAEAHTPAIDAFARESVLFERHYAAAPTTLASHTSLFTGNYPHTHGVPRNDHEVDESNLMLPEILRQAGFTTGAVLGAMPLATPSRFPQGFDHVDEAFTKVRTLQERGQTERDGADVVRSSLEWLDTRTADERVFLFVHFFDAHAPYAPLPEHRPLFHPDEGIENAGQMEHIWRVQGMYRRDDPDAKRHGATLRALYLAGVASLDQHVGALLTGLERRGWLDDTLVIVTADHGETFDAHRERFDHGETVYDETVHTPLLVRFPGGWRSGVRIGETVSNVDVLPTLLELLGLAPARTDGQSLAGLLRALPWAGREGPVFAEATKPHAIDATGWQNDRTQKAIVDRTWKLISTPRQERVELYDLAADPGEREDRREQQPQIVQRLDGALQVWRAEAEPLPSASVTDERVKAELGLLGYVDDPPESTTQR